MRFLPIFFFLSFLTLSVFGDIPGHLITSLPGYPNGGRTPSKQYSGMIPVAADGSRSLHYWLVLSENNPETDPITLWTNGGPGCSSMDGFLNFNYLIISLNEIKELLIKLYIIK